MDTRDYGRLARDRDPDPDGALPAGDDLSVPGLGPLAGTRVRIAGLYGGGLHSVTEDGWSVDVAAPDWPSHRVLLSTNGGRYDGPAGTHWWHIFHADYSELRAMGFSPSGRSLVVATSSDITLLTRAPETTAVLGYHFALTADQERRLLAAADAGDQDAVGEIVEEIEETDFYADDLRVGTRLLRPGRHSRACGRLHRHLRLR